MKCSCSICNELQQGEQWKTGIWKPIQSNLCCAVTHHRFECSHGGGNPAPLYKSTWESKCHLALPEAIENQKRERTDASLSSPGCDVAAGNKLPEPHQDLLTRQ